MGLVRRSMSKGGEAAGEGQRGRKLEWLDFIRGHSEESYSGHIKYICAGTALLREG